MAAGLEEIEDVKVVRWKRGQGREKKEWEERVGGRRD